MTMGMAMHMDTATPMAWSIPRSPPVIAECGRSSGRSSGSLLTAALQVVVVLLSGSVALLADTIHNFADAATAIPLAVAFWFGRKKPSARFTFGYGRVEDLAGVAIVLTILASAIVAGYESIQRLLHPQDVSYLWAVIAASIIGFPGQRGRCDLPHQGRPRDQQRGADRRRVSRPGRRLDQPGRAVRRGRRLARLSARRSDRRTADHRRDLRHRSPERKIDLHPDARWRRSAHHPRNSTCRRACAPSERGYRSAGTLARSSPACRAEHRGRSPVDGRASPCDRRRGSPSTASSFGLFVAGRHPRRPGGSGRARLIIASRRMLTTACRPIHMVERC